MSATHRGWTAGTSIWLAIVAASVAAVGVLWGLSWSGAEDAVVGALSDQLTAEAGLVSAHLREVPVEVLSELGGDHAGAAVQVELDRLLAASGLHDLAVLGPQGEVLGSDGSWLPAAADADLVARARAGEAQAGPLYRAEDGALYLAAYAPLQGHPGWVVAVEGSATLGAVDALARRVAAAGVVVLLVATLLGAVLASFVARPMRRLDRELQAVRPGDPPERIEVSGPREVQKVATAAQELLVAIRVRDQAVRSAHARELDQLTRLAAEIAHEVRNPLNAMSLSTERMAQADDPDQRQRLAERLRAQLDELDAIVSRLVDLTRPLEVSLTDVDLGALVEGVANDLHAQVLVRRPLPPGLRSDPTLLTEVMRNLLLNADQAGASRIEVTVAATDGRWQIAVHDDGPGVDDAARAFDWFHTTRASGSGLGLPVSRRIAESLGGSLTLVASRPATFRLELPT